MTILLSTNDEGDEGLGSNPNVQVQGLGPAILVPSQAIGNVVARTNILLAGHRQWLNSLPQRTVREQRQNKARDAPASKCSQMRTPFYCLIDTDQTCFARPNNTSICFQTLSVAATSSRNPP